jgi:stage II sporulation protein E
MFATVDMLILNLSTGAAEFIKLAACASLVVRGDGIYRVEGGRLPMGILERVQPAVTRIQLQPGDVILMASDGVMDAVDVQSLYDDLRRGGKSMPDMAQEVLNLAENTRRNFRRDDMTAICIRLEAHERLGKAV